MGGKKARVVLAHFGTVGKAMSASREEWLQIPGMGNTTVDKILAVLNG
jgi:ERCC4-type nuclease